MEIYRNQQLKLYGGFMHRLHSFRSSTDAMRDIVSRACEICSLCTFRSSARSRSICSFSDLFLFCIWI